MATLSFTGKTFDEANAFLGSKNERKIGNNTVLVRTSEGIKVRLHDHTVVLFTEDKKVFVSSAGWKTTTTKDRINQFISGYVFQKKGIWFYKASDGTIVPFTDGMIVS